MSRLLLNVLFVKFPVGQVLGPFLQPRRERRKKKETVTEMVRVPSGREAERQPGGLAALSTHGRQDEDGKSSQRRNPPWAGGAGGKEGIPDASRAEAGQRHGQGTGRAKTRPGQRQGEERGFHLENLFLHLLQPPQHPRESQRSRAGGRQAGEVFWPAQLQVRLGSGSPGPGWTLATSRHLL